MRKFKLSCFLLIILLLSGCAVKPVSAKGNADKLSIVAAAFPHFDFARSIAGDKADIRLLLSPGAEAHSYEPTPQDIIAIENCDLFIYTGGESDEWIKDILSSLDSSEIHTLSLMDCVSLREEEIQEGMTSDDHDHDHDEHDDHDEYDDHDDHDDHEHEYDEYDEHVWTSPKNAELICESIKQSLCEIDPDNAAIYEANSDAYADKLSALDNELRELVSGAERNTVIFGDRFPFLYLFREYSLRYYAAFPGCADDTDANPSTVAFLIDKVKEEKIPVVFKCDLSAGRLADTIAEETGAKVLTLYSCHTLSKDDFQYGESYLSLMERNVSALREALS